MEDATSAWMQACNIKFQHVEGQDESLPGATPPPGVTFTVRRAAQDFQIGAGFEVARSFFPGDPADTRHLWLRPFYFQGGSFDRTGVLRHELGHVLGFLHEFTRPETPPRACNHEELGEGIPLGRFDVASVMQYFCPQAGLGTTTMELTALDIAGAQSVYGEPG
jgi:hypothetical protein